MTICSSSVFGNVNLRNVYGDWEKVIPHEGMLLTCDFNFGVEDQLMHSQTHRGKNEHLIGDLASLDIQN